MWLRMDHRKELLIYLVGYSLQLPHHVFPNKHDVKANLHLS